MRSRDPVYADGEVHIQYGDKGSSTSGRPEKRISGAHREIWLACAVISLPMMILSALLLGLIFYNRVNTNSSTSPDFHLPQVADDDQDAYLVKFSSTRLITIASWTSSVAPLLPGFVMTLLSFPTARHISKSSQLDRAASLPTPYQLNLYLGLLTGGFGSLWQWAKYTCWRQREGQASVVRTLAVGLTTATLLGFLILAADTWLHVTTSTVEFTQITPTSSSASYTYGRGLYSDQCNTRSDLGNNPCTVDSAATAQFLMGASEAYQTLSNVSSINRIFTFEHEGVAYTYLGEANIPNNVDFQASTFALTTQCKAISKACGLTAAYGASTPFTCTSAFQGDVTALKGGGPIGIVLLEDDTLTTNITFGSKDLNPYYFGTWALVDTQGHLPGQSSLGGILQDDPEIVTPVHGGVAWVLSCATTVYEVAYSSINGTVQALSITPANATLGGIIAAPTNEGFGQSDIEIAARISSFSTTSQELADKWAALYSQTALGLSAGVMSPRSNIQQQTRSIILVARVPKLPLFVLIGLNLLYSLVGILLALYAACFSSPSATRDIQARLTVAGLAAICFESRQQACGAVEHIRDLFTEKIDRGTSSRVGIKPAEEGGWSYTSL